MTDSLVRPIQVTAAAFADLGPDTAICASAWLLETADPDMSYLWKRLYCDANAPNTYDYGILDSIRVSEHNGQTDGLSAYYILADGLNNILQIRQEPQFAPPGAGNYQVLGFYTSSSTPPSGLQIGNAIGDIAPSSNACSGMSAPLAISVGEESNTDCPITYDFSTLDSIRVSESNGQTEGLNAYYILTDRLSNILQIRPEPLFMPPGAGNYKVYGLYTSLASPPNGLQIDNAIFDVDLSADACGGISAPLDISVAEEEIIGTGLKVVIRESGTYILVATDGCGNTASDTIQITLNEGCVWPGDVNVDGQVSLLDFVSLGLADGQNGPARPNASSIWNSQVANDWGISFDMINQLSPGVDFKHADCDGNGVVDLAMDAEVIKTNLGAFHEIEVPADNMGAELRVEHQNTIFSSLDTAIINLNFYLEGPGQSELEGVYGVLFQLNFSDPVVKAPDFQSDTAGWMSPALEMNAFWDGSQQTPGIQGLREYRKTSGFAMVSDNKVARMGKGGIGGGAVIVTIDDLADDPSLLGFSTFTISVDNLVIVDTAGQLQSVTLASELNTITVQLNWPIGNNILPLDWLDIAVQQVGKDAQLDWHVAAEEGIQYYILERSVDAKAFKPIALLPAKQNGQAENRYQYLDMDVLNSGFSELYYRVKQLDLDGHLSYSEQVSLRLQQNFGLLLRAWPNPHTDQLTIAYQTDQDSPLRLRIVNNMGKELSRQSLFESRGTFTLSTQHWAAGMYYVVLESEHQRSVMKVVKAE
ncbi:MAG: T9SS type A sorting domain-containing protein [Bacteroidia bacterium]